MLKLGAYEAWFDGETIVPGETLQERLANLEAWGYQGIQLSRPSRELGLQAIVDALAGSSVRLCIYGGGRGLLSAAPTQRQAAVQRIKEGLSQAAELGQTIWPMCTWPTATAFSPARTTSTFAPAWLPSSASAMTGL